MKKILLLLILIISNHAFAANYSGEIMPFKQPDGSMVDVKLFGSEYYMRGEGLDSYTLVRDPHTNFLCYAKLSEDGSKLLSTGIPYRGIKTDLSTLRSDLNIPFHIQINLEARHKVIEENKRLLGFKDNRNNLRTGNPQQQNTFNGTAIHPVSGNIKGLCIVVDFSDEPGTLPMTEFNDFCNDTNYSNFNNHGSLRSFYRDVSGGLVDYQNVVFGYFRAPQTFAYYDSQPFATGAQTVLGLALNWIKNTGFDFSTLSINPDQSIMAINLMYTGYPPNWSQGMWFHKGSYTGFSANGVHSDDYNCSPANSPLYISTVCHENGHMIGKWPDTYKYDSSQDGIGSFDLMCASGDSYNPVPPNPLFSSNAGWTKVIDVTNFNGLNYDTANSLTAYRYTNTNDTNEFFMMEHHMKVMRSTSMPDEGLVIWHMNRNGDAQTLDQEVFLEHSNNDWANEYNACYDYPYFDKFRESTTPNSKWYDGSYSGLIVWDIDSVHGNVLPYKIGLGFAGPSLNISYVNISGDNNSNGFLESGETGNINLDVNNLGQTNSGNSILSCSAVGSTANYVTNIATGINVGVINMNQTIQQPVGITIDPSAPVGTIINLEFMLTDNIDTTYFTRVLVVGAQSIMSSVNDTTCAAIFYDPGFINNYPDNALMQKTIYPSIPGNYIHADFSFFDLENDIGCNNDFLNIYDGANSFSPLIGRYCGNVSPGSIQATNPAGALTFVFVTDGTTNGTGWEANISCSPVLGTIIIEKQIADAFPNPTTGIAELIIPAACEVDVYDTFGRNIIGKSFDGPTHYVVDLTEEMKGLYIVKFEFENQVVIKKIVRN